MEVRELKVFNSWMRAADHLETLDVPEGPAYPLDALAEGLRAHNCRHHPDVPDWDDATDQVKTIWRERAEGVAAEIEKAIQRRPI
jgi:diadenosine tetraphosphatase ApaH/serine/threonine PP2A family protein phosphatase